MRVLSWNLFHGRSQPPARRSLTREFAQVIASWSWDVALLQEVPPWWPPPLAAAAGAEQRSAITSRNAALALRRAIAERRPDLIKSNGGGCNAILARAPILAHRVIRLRTRPERRVAQLCRLANGTVVANFHASTRPALAADELERLWQQALTWAGASPLVLGGDLNLRAPRAPLGEIQHVAARDVDHVFSHRLGATGEPHVLERRVLLDERTVALSDHAPLLVEVGRR